MTAADHHHAWNRLPVGTLTDIIGPGTALILAPHPDDESLGCGGLIAACNAAARPPLIAVLTDGAGSHHSQEYPPDRLRTVRAQELKTAVTRLGLPPDRLVFLNQPDTRAPQDGPEFDAIVASLLALIRRDPDCTAILAPWRHDPHTDHEAAALLAHAVAKAAPVRNVAYPVWGWTLRPDAPVPTPPDPGYRLDIAKHLPVKQAAIHAHQSQYGTLITDDPAGFRLPADLLSAFNKPFETFLLP